YGVLNTAINIILYIILVIDFGFNLSATREISQKKNNFVAVSKIFTDVIFAKIILFFGVLVFTFLILKLIPDYQDVTRLVYFMLPQVLSSILFPLWLYQGYEKIGYAAFINVLGKCITIPLLLIFVQNSKDVTNAA
ncbi:TPA: O12 family O-antigen flippase, partial [Escherichia coli]|nr:O12 family O-antigen flippase [Escherichia coli]